MTTITKFSVFSHLNELGGKVWNPAIRWTSKFAVFIVLEDDQGNSGIGECWCFDTAPDSLVAFLRTEIAPNFIGTALDDYEGLNSALQSRATLTARHGILMSALSGVDIAIWDLRAQLAGLPLWNHLNPNGHGCAPLYGSGGLYGVDKGIPQLAAEMNAMVDDHFHLIKMKVGALELADDIARVQAVIDALPTHVKLIVDCVYSYNTDDAKKLYESLPEGRVEALQSPVPAADLKALARLSKAGIPVMAIESEYREEIHRYLVEDCAIAFLQTAPIASGGISGVMALSELVQSTSTKLSLEVSSTAIALMASCHLAAADNNVVHVERHYIHQVFFDDLKLQVHPTKPGQFEFPRIPGLGISLQQSDVKAEFHNIASSQKQKSQQAVQWLNNQQSAN